MPLLLLFCAVAGGGCHPEGSGPTPPPGAAQPPVTVLAERQSLPEPAGPDERKLEPIPEAPQIRVAPQADPAAGALTVVAARPTGAVAGEVRPTITFSRPVMALGTVAQEQGRSAVARITPELPGEWRWLGSASVEFVPRGLVPYSTHFRVEVPAGLVALDGARLEQPYRFEFSTPAPRIETIEPYNGFAFVPQRPVFKLLLNQPVRDLLGHLSLTAGGRPVTVTLLREVSIAEEQRAVEEERLKAEGRERPVARPEHAEHGFMSRLTRYELQPVAPLPLDSELALTIDAGLAGREGPLTLGKQASYTFRTYGPLAITDVRACLYSSTGDRCSAGPLYLLATNPIDLVALRGRVAIEPPVEIHWEEAESNTPQAWSSIKVPYVVLPGAFLPGTQYRVRVAAGVADEFGQTAGPFEGTVRLDDLEPEFGLGSRLALLEAAGKAELPVRSVNLRQGRAAVWSLTPGELARQLAWEPWSKAPAPQPAGRPASLDFDLGGAKNRVHWSPLPLRRWLAPGQRSGFLLIEGWAPELQQAAKLQPRERERVPERVIAQITDLAVHAKLGTASGVLWVTSLSRGTPVAGAELHLLDRAGRSRWQGRSDGDGLARTPGLAELLPEEHDFWQPPFALALASKGGDTGATLSTWTGDYWPGSFDLDADWEDTTPCPQGLIFTDRGIYRPGDEVFVQGVARYRQLGKLRRPEEGARIALTVTDSRSKPASRQELELTGYGTFQGRVALPADAPLGLYVVDAEVAVDGQPVRYHGSFRVEEYRPPHFLVDVSLPQPAYVAGEVLQGQVLARYLFGGAMAGAKVHWSAARRTVAWRPSGNEGFLFGPSGGWWENEGEDAAAAAEIFGGGDGEADGKGAFVAEVGKAEAPGRRTWEYTVEAEVTDVDRQRMANRAVAIVHPAAVHGGLRVAQQGFAEVGKPLQVELIAVTPEGERRGGARLSLELRRREWKSIRQQSPSGEWTTTSEAEEVRVGGCEVKSARAAVTCELTPALPGLHVLELTAADEQGRESVTRSLLYVVGGGWVSWQQDQEKKLELVPDKAVYDVGETAHILVKNPYPEAEALLTVEREGVFTARRVVLRGSSPTLDVPLGEELLPNAFVGLILVRGRVAAAQVAPEGEQAARFDPGHPLVRMGYTQLRIEKKSKRLTVLVKPDREEKRPGDRVALELQVNDSRGRGTQAEVTVWAVDEGVLRLTDYRVPDPVEAIHPLRGLSVRIGEPLLHLVLERPYGDKGKNAGGGGSGGEKVGAGLRTKFGTTVLFRSVVTDARGRARTEFTLPDNLTTFRIMAMAVTPGDRLGTGEGKVVVARPLLALPALPRLARVGDRLEAGVVVHAHGLAANEAQVRAEVEGLEAEGPLARQVSLKGGKPQEVRFAFRAGQAGTATLRFFVEGGGERDGVERKIPVELPVALEAVATYGETDGQREEALAPPRGIRPDTGSLELTLSSTLLGSFGEGMRQLVEYPYGCLEQLGSRLVPFVALRELQDAFGPPSTGGSPAEEGAQDDDDAAAAARRERAELIARWLGEPAPSPQDTQDPDAIVRRTVQAIEALQRPDGGFGYWPSSRCSDAFGSAYAVLALSLARRAGYPVSDEVLARGQGFLAETVAAGRCIDCGWGCAPPRDATRIFALYALARSGSPRPSFYAALYERRAALPLFAQAMLADVLATGGGDAAQAETVLAELLNHARESAGEVHFEESDPLTHAALWSSDTRTTAIVLQTLTDVQPAHPYVGKIARYLGKVRQGNGRFRNTQEAAFALMALAEVVRTKEKEVPDFTAQVLLGREPVASAPFHGRSLEVTHTTVSMDRLAGLDRQVPLVFARQGEAGILYYGALLRYAPAELPAHELERGLLVQRWFEPFTGGGQSRQFYAGDLVRVRVRLGSHMARNHVVLEVPLPAGLEAVDTTLASTARLPPSTRGEGPQEGYAYESDEDTSHGAEQGSPYAHQFFSPFNHHELRDDRVAYFADYLPPGVHVASFVARATTIGDFVLKPAHAEEMYTPEVFGRSDGGRFRVIEARRVAER